MIRRLFVALTISSALCRIPTLAAGENPPGASGRQVAEEREAIPNAHALAEASLARGLAVAANDAGDVRATGIVAVLDVPSRRVLALAASRQLERETGVRRAIGSAFASVVYASALASQRFTLASRLKTAPPDIGWRREPVHPRPPMRLRETANQGLLPPVYRLVEAIGPETIHRTGQALGLFLPAPPAISIVIQATATPVELANLYATFADGGRYAPVIQAGTPATERREQRVLSPQVAFLMTSLLTTMATARLGSGVPPTAWGTSGVPHNGGGAWFVGGVARYACAVWVRPDQSSAAGMHRARAAAGAIWLDLLRQLPPGKPAEPPPGIVTVTIHPHTGRRVKAGGKQGGIREHFLPGTAPR